MKPQGLLLRLMLKAAWVRKDRALTALVSIIVVATMATVALTVYSDLEGKFSHEFRSFGVNVIVTARSGSLSENDLAEIRTIAGENSKVVPVGYAVAQSSNGSPVVIGGTDLQAFKELNSWWSLQPLRKLVHNEIYLPQSQPDSLLVPSIKSPTGDALLGSRAEDLLSPKGDPIPLTYDGKTIQVQVAAVFHSGSDDDSRIYLSLKDFERLTGLKPNTAQLRIEGTPVEVEQRAAILSASLPEVEVNPVRMITSAQTAILGKTRAIVLTASAVVVVLIVLCMVATLTGAVLERRKDFAVMKALGASNRKVNLLFAGEAVLISLGGAIVGFAAGTAIAFWIGKVNFGAAILPRPELLLPVVLGSIVLALIAATAPLNLLRRIQPAGILRGE